MEKSKNFPQMKELLRIAMLAPFLLTQQSVGSLGKEKVFYKGAAENLVLGGFSSQGVADATADALILADVNNICPDGTDRLVATGYMDAIIIKTSPAKQSNNVGYMLYPAVVFEDIKPSKRIRKFQPLREYTFSENGTGITFKCLKNGKRLETGVLGDQTLAIKKIKEKYLKSFLLNQLQSFVTSIWADNNVNKRLADIYKSKGESKLRTYVQATIWNPNSTDLFEKGVSSVFTIGNLIGYGKLNGDDVQAVLDMSRIRTYCAIKNGKYQPKFVYMILSPWYLKSGKNPCRPSMPNKSTPLPKPRPKDWITVDPANN